MATLEDVRRICGSISGSVAGSDSRFSYGISVKGKLKGFVWTWAEKVHPKKARVENQQVVAVRVPTLLAKDLLIESDPDKFFTEPHYDGYKAVLVRLDAVSIEELEDLLEQAAECVG